MKSNRMLVFPPFRLDPANQQLWRESELLFLRPKTFAVLVHLAEHAGRLITQAELLHAVWPGMAVSDELLRGYIHELRRILHDDAASPRFIETAARRGYRFLPSVTETSVSDPEDETISLAAVAPDSSLLVGREAEMTRLSAFLAAAMKGERQIVFVSGEPGIGKTSLIETFLANTKIAIPALIATGQCVEHYGAGEPYLPVLQALGSLCRAENGALVVEHLDRYAPTWLAQIPGTVSGAQLEDLSRRVQGVTQARMLRELSEALEVLAMNHLVILALEDLHWSDHSTLELISMVARRRPPAKLMLFGTFRPADLIVAGHPLRALARDLKARGQSKELALRHLADSEISDHLDARFPKHRFPEDLARVIYASTDGNPLFMTTLLDDLVAERVVQRVGNVWHLRAAIEAVADRRPDNLRQLIAGQIERFSPSEQRVLEAAGVAGSEFASAAVAAALEITIDEVEDCCRALAAREQFLRSSGAVEWPDGTTAARFSFIHALYRQGTLDRISPRQRQEWHRRIGDRLEAAYGSRTEEVASELAVHFERAREWRRAIRYFTLAGEAAKRTSAHAEAMTQITRALELVPKLSPQEQPACELDLRLRLGPIVMTRSGFASAEGERVYSRAQELADQMGASPSQLFGILWGQWLLHSMRAEWNASRVLGERLFETAQQVGDKALLLQAYHARGNTFVYAGEPVSGLDQARKCIDLYLPELHHQLSFLYGAHDPAVCSMAHEAVAHWLLGYPGRALAAIEHCVGLARKLSHPHSLAIALVYGFMTHQLRRERREAAAYADAVIALSTEHDFKQWLLMGRLFAIWSGEHDPKVNDLTVMKAILEQYRLTGANRGRPWMLAMLAERFQTVAPTEAFKALDAAIESVGTGERWYEPELHRLRGDLLVSGRRPRIAEAERCYRSAIETARAQGAKSWELRASNSLARLLEKQDRRTDARAALRQLYRSFTEGFDTTDLKDTKSLLASRKSSGPPPVRY